MKRWPLWKWVALAGAFVHVGWALLGYRPPLIGDAGQYDAIARSLCEGDGYAIGGEANTNYMPGYTLMLAAIYKVLGARVGPVLVAQGAMVAASAAVMGSLASRLSGPRAALIATATLVLLPATFVRQNDLGSEALLLLLTATFAWALNLLLTGAKSASTLLGITLGLLVLTKPEHTVYALCIVIAAWKVRRWHAWKPVVWSAMVSLAVIAPWSIRTSQVVGRFTPLSTITGRSLLMMAIEPQAVETDAPALIQASLPCQAMPDAADYDRCCGSVARRLIRERPGVYLRHTAANVARLWLGSHTEVAGALSPTFATLHRQGSFGLLAVKLLFFAVHAVFVALGLAALVRYRAWPLVGILACAVIGKVLIHALIFATPRYGLHFAPFFALGIALLVVGAPRRRSTP